MSLSKGFQTQVNVQPAPRRPMANVRQRQSAFAVVLEAGQGALIAGPNGVRVGRFAWASYQFADSDGAPAVVNNTGSGPVTGFVHREQQGLIVNYLDESSMIIRQGYASVTLYDGGDFWVKNAGAFSNRHPARRLMPTMPMAASPSPRLAPPPTAPPPATSP